ncbi:MAG: acetate kinase, partial [Pseudomonadota bacterium]
MRVLVLNCGSSSLKFLIVSIDPETTEDDRVMCLARGIIERIGGVALLTFQREGKPVFRHACYIADHEAAVRRVIAWVDSANPALVDGGVSGISAVGHRVVHGGERFTRPTIIDESVTFAIDSLEYIAPLHNPPSLAGIHATRAVLGPSVPMVAVFDTAFHATLPERASRYAIPYELSLRHGIRRYGFH